MRLSQRDRDTLERLEEELWREDTRFDIGRMEGCSRPTSSSLADPAASTGERTRWRFRADPSTLCCRSRAFVCAR